MQNKVILITGSNGEIGQALIKKFIKNPINQIITIDLEKSENDCLVYKSFHGSILDEKLIDNINNKYQINEIYHLAAILSTKAENNPTLATNVNINGTKNILDLSVKQCEKYNNQLLFFFPSSIAVYNTQKSTNQKINEKLFCENPLTLYGKTKLISESYGVNIEKNSNVDFRCIRFPGIISATSKPTGGTSDYAPEMIHAAANGKNYNCFANKNSILPFIVMPDAINAIEMIMTVPKSNLSSNIYNITSFSPTIEDLLSKILCFFPKFKMNFSINESRQNIINSWPNYIDDRLANNDWGWVPDFNFNKSYQDYLIPNILKYYNEGN